LLIFLTPHVALQPELLRGQTNSEMHGVKLVPNAVQPGTFQDQINGMKLGATTRPSADIYIPPIAPSRSSAAEEIPLPGVNR
jgi:hypothetical protein